MWTNANEINRPAPALSRQPSIYSLTFDEFQSSMGGIGNDGKDFGSMNMEDFLKNLWTAEEGQAMLATVGGHDCGAGALQRQGSLTLPRTLSQKTVDDVWRDLMCDNAESGSGSDLPQQQRQPTLGEMTLEEFLLRAGVVREEIRPTVLNNSSNTSVYYGDLAGSDNSNSAFTFTFPQVDQSNVSLIPKSLSGNSGANLPMLAAGVIGQYAAQLPLGANGDRVNLNQQGMGGGVIGIVDPINSTGSATGMAGLGVGAVGVTVAGSTPVNQITFEGLVKGNGELSSLSPVSYVFNGGLRGRKGNGAVEKVVERRQRRMIKNRESAARSRARKQAYTIELEAEIAKLKEKNEELQKKQIELLEMQKNQVLKHLNEQLGPKKLCLRRTQTGRW